MGIWRMLCIAMVSARVSAMEWWWSTTGKSADLYSIAGVQLCLCFFHLVNTLDIHVLFCAQAMKMMIMVVSGFLLKVIGESLPHAAPSQAAKHPGAPCQPPPQGSSVSMSTDLQPACNSHPPLDWVGQLSSSCTK